MALPLEPSYFWQMYKPVIVRGGTLPLEVAVRLRPIEMDLLYRKMLVLKYEQWGILKSKLEGMKDSIDGMSKKASDALRREQIAEMERLLAAWAHQREASLPILREAMQLGYF